MSDRIEETLLDAAVGVDAAVAQERPVAPHLLLAGEVDLADQDLLLVDRGLGDDDAEGIAEERRAPELEAGLSGQARLVAHAVHGREVDAVRDGVAALDGLPGVALGDAVLGLLVRVP